MNFFASHRQRWRLLGALAVAALSSGCSDNSSDNGNDIPDPQVIASRGGVLDVRLEQAPSPITVAGRSFTSNVFNGQYIPPVLLLQRGDRMELELVNRIGAADVQIDGPQESNLHYHGMVIPPAAPGDDVYLQVDAGANYHYRWQVPPNHSLGTHWYHPHAHGLVEPHILSGMSGMLVIDGLVAQHYPEYTALRERYLILKDIDLPGAADGDPKTKTINGLLGGILRMRPGEMQVWNLGNLGADAYFDLAVGGVQLWEIGRDGNVLQRPKLIDNVFLPPGARSTVVVVASDTAGVQPVTTLEVDTGPQGDENAQVQLATLVVDGAPIDSALLQARLLLPAQDQGSIVPTPEQVAALPITRQRTIVFSETADGNTFFLNGQEYDMSRDDVTVTLGDVEEWTLVNVSGERHVFHIHQLDFLVKSINNQDIDETGMRDVIDIPYQQNGVPGEVKIIVPFTNPIMVGRFVFHCHIVEHEDKGMMANIVVQPAGQAAMSPALLRTVMPAAPANLFTRFAQWTGLREAPPPLIVESDVCRSRDAVASRPFPFGAPLSQAAPGLPARSSVR